MRGIVIRYILLAIFIILVIIAYFALIPNKNPISTTSTTIKPAICGNNICDSDEDRFNCCSDCACNENEICNEIKQRCELEFSLTESDAKKAVVEHLGNDYNMSVGSITQYQGKKVMFVYVYTPETKLFAVDENSVVTEIELD